MSKPIKDKIIIRAPTKVWKLGISPNIKYPISSIGIIWKYCIGARNEACDSLYALM